MPTRSWLLLLFAPICARAQETTNWYTLSIGGERSGYVREVRRVDSGGWRIARTWVVEVQQLRARSLIRREMVAEWSETQKSLALEYAARTGVESWRWRGRMVDRVLEVDAPGAKPARLDDGVLMPYELEAALARSGPSATIEVFDPETFAIDALAIAASASANGRHVRVEGEHAEDWWFGADGGLERIDARLFGVALTQTRCAHDCDAPVERPFDPMARLVARLPSGVPARALHGSVRYALARDDGTAPELADTGEQTISWDGARAVVTVCDSCFVRGWPPDRRLLQRYLAPNAWVQSDAPEIVAVARRARRTLRVEGRMRALVEIVRSRMRGRVDYLGYADALHALRTGAGDCTEYSLLLAALARAQGIPARVVVGMAYSNRLGGNRDVLGPHVWVQAWTGTRWRSFDAALGSFDTTHIAIGVGDGDPAQTERASKQLQRLRIESVAVLRTP